MSARSRKSTIESYHPSRLSQHKDQPAPTPKDVKEQFVRIGLKGNNLIQHNQRAITPLIGRNGKVTNGLDVFRPPTAEQIIRVELAQRGTTPSKNTDATSRKGTVSDANQRFNNPFRNITPQRQITPLSNQFYSTVVTQPDQMSPKSTILNTNLAQKIIDKDYESNGKNLKVNIFHGRSKSTISKS